MNESNSSPPTSSALYTHEVWRRKLTPQHAAATRHHGKNDAVLWMFNVYLRPNSVNYAEQDVCGLIRPLNLSLLLAFIH